MGKYTEKKDVKEALKKSKEIEKEHVLTPTEEVVVQKEATSFSEKLRRLLAPQWFMKDVREKEGIPKKKTETPVKKKTKKKKK